MAPAGTTVALTPEGYLRHLRALGAWWCLGSSAVAPYLLAHYAAALPTGRQEARW